jgi:hypothetical protein
MGFSRIVLIAVYYSLDFAPGASITQHRGQPNLIDLLGRCPSLKRFDDITQRRFFVNSATSLLILCSKPRLIICIVAWVFGS